MTYERVTHINEYDPNEGFDERVEYWRVLLPVRGRINGCQAGEIADNNVHLISKKPTYITEERHT